VLFFAHLECACPDFVLFFSGLVVSFFRIFPNIVLHNCLWSSKRIICSLRIHGLEYFWGFKLELGNECWYWLLFLSLFLISKWSKLHGLHNMVDTCKTCRLSSKLATFVWDKFVNQKFLWFHGHMACLKWKNQWKSLIFTRGFPVIFSLEAWSTLVLLAWYLLLVD
jgi:hypothetical protein